jgi:glyoxylase-like metal-dependent hydrolase (beta-lactamase superfamily II)
MWALDGPWLTIRRDELLDGASPDPVRIPVPSFLVEHDDGLVLIDSGFDPAAVADPVATYGEVGHQIEFSADQRVDAQLAARGFRTGDVTHVVVSHVHFDHTGGLKLFGHARFLLGRGDAPAVRGDDSPVTELSRQADLEPLRDATWEYLDGGCASRP